jgi:hypothetical protein
MLAAVVAVQTTTTLQERVEQAAAETAAHHRMLRARLELQIRAEVVAVGGTILLQPLVALVVPAL